MKKKDRGVKQFLGMPMRWDRKNMFKNYWNPSDSRLFPPKYFGIGWSVNFHAVLNELGLIKKKRKRPAR